MGSFKAGHQYQDRIVMSQAILGLDDEILDEMLEALDPDADGDPLLTPWRRGHRVAIRSAFSH